MNKTTVYLPDDLKARLARTAADSGLSEAELIRQAIGARVDQAPRPRPRGGLFASGDADLSSAVDDSLQGFGER